MLVFIIAVVVVGAVNITSNATRTCNNMLVVLLKLLVGRRHDGEMQTCWTNNMRGACLLLNGVVSMYRLLYIVQHLK